MTTFAIYWAHSYNVWMVANYSLLPVEIIQEVQNPQNVKIFSLKSFIVNYSIDLWDMLNTSINQ